MSELLIIYLPCHETDPVTWCVWSNASATLKAKGQCDGIAKLDKIITLYSDLAIYTLLPGEWTSVHNVTLPKGSHRQLEKILPCLLEDDLCEDIETLHFATINVQGNRASVVVVSNKVMQQVQLWLHDLGLQNYSLLPDWMSLPVGEKIYGSLLPDDRCLLRYDQWSGTCASNEMIPQLLNTLRQQYPERQQIEFSGEIFISTHPLIAKLRNLGWDIEINRKYTVVNWASNGDRANLLVGRYAPHNSYMHYWERWKKLGTSMLLLLALAGGERAFALWSITFHAQQAQLAAEQEFRRIFPQQQKIVNLRAQLNAMYKSLADESNNIELLTLLPSIASALSSESRSLPITIVGIKFDQKLQEIRLQLQANEFEDIDKLKGKLAKHFDVEQSALFKEDNRVTGSLMLKGKTG